MLYSEIIAVCSQIHTKHINTLCGQNVELSNVKPGGIYNKPVALRGLPSNAAVSIVSHSGPTNVKNLCHVAVCCSAPDGTYSPALILFLYSPFTSPLVKQPLFTSIRSTGFAQGCLNTSFTTLYTLPILHSPLLPL